MLRHGSILYSNMWYVKSSSLTSLGYIRDGGPSADVSLVAVHRGALLIVEVPTGQPVSWPAGVACREYDMAVPLRIKML